MGTQIKYVQPFNDVSACTSEPCTFDQFAQNPEQYFLSGTTFIFHPGDHQLYNTISLHGIQNISFQGMSVEESAIIRLGPQIGLSFDDCDGIEIKSLNLILSGDFEYRIMFSDTNDVKIHNVIMRQENENSIGCSAIVSKASNVTISNSSFMDISGQSGAALVVFNSPLITFTGSNRFTNNSAKLGGAIHSVRSTLQFTGPGVASFVNNTAISNENDTYTPCFSNVFSNDNGLGGAVLAEHSHVIISSCAQFVGNIATYRGGAIAATNSSTIVIDGSMCSNELHPRTVLFDGNRVTTNPDSSLDVTSGSGGAIFMNNSDHVNMTNMTLTNNFSPGVGGALHFNQTNVMITLYNVNAANNTADSHYGGAISIVLCNQVFIDGDNYFVNNSAHTLGGAIDIFLVEFMKIGGTSYFQGNRANYGGAIDIFTVTMSLVCGNNIFKKNSAINGFGGAILIYNASVVHVCGINTFTEGVADQGGALYIEKSTILFNGTNMTLFNSNTATSDGGAIANLDSQAMLFGKIQFNNNSATGGNGGAMALYGTSRVALNPLSTIDFVDNYALLDGGAIYFEDSVTSRQNCYVTKAECFIMLNTTYTSLDNASISLNFTNNSAGGYGAVLYGGQLGRCNLLFDNTINDTCRESTVEMQENSYEIMKNLTNLEEENSIVLPPETLCLCNNTPNELECTSVFTDTLTIQKELAPGQVFRIAMIARDQRNFNVPGVRVVNDPVGKSYPLTRVTNTITTSLSCQNFTYRLLVESTEAKPSYNFYISGLCGRDRGHVNLSITLKPCPVGFNFSPRKRACVCTNMLNAFSTVECDIDNKSINRSRNDFWINITDNYFLIYDGSCPLDYCNDSSKTVIITPNEPDAQCFKGRSGKLCGSCKSGESYSLVLGSLECQQNCSHVSLLLVILFGVLGILLIVLLFILRLTVSTGTINGMIFYANIVQANHQVFLPKITSEFNFIVVFISWLNLDFGIHACFFDGLNINIYSWLQFLFPLYLWILVVIIVVSAHYSQRVAKRIGHNPVAVLATVLLISYGKMLKAIIVPLSIATLKNVTQSESSIHVSLERVWLFNGDTKYSDPGHVALVTISILVLVFLFLPYTLLLLFGHWLQTKSHWRFLSWINKLKPLMDAYYAPFKKGKCYWLGLFLLVRFVLFLSVAFTPFFNDYVINLVIVSTVIAGLSMIKGQIYEKRYNDFLESSFLLNLCFLSIASSYVQSKNSSDPNEVIRVQNILSHISVVIAFVYFIGIITFHTYQRLGKIAAKAFQCVNKGYRLKNHDEKAYNEQSLEIITHSSLNLRELLLDDDS